ncbi:MAG: hypothetical protein WBC63_02055 [Candidatus Bipolaricaulia bacterium]
MQKEVAFSIAGFLFGLFAIPVLVFSGGSLLLGALFCVVAIGTSMAGMAAGSRTLRALTISGFAMGVAGLWYTITGWAVSLNIAASIESLF